MSNKPLEEELMEIGEAGLAQQATYPDGHPPVYGFHIDVFRDSVTGKVRKLVTREDGGIIEVR